MPSNWATGTFDEGPLTVLSEAGPPGDERHHVFRAQGRPYIVFGAVDSDAKPPMPEPVARPSHGRRSNAASWEALLGNGDKPLFGRLGAAWR